MLEEVIPEGEVLIGQRLRVVVGNLANRRGNREVDLDVVVERRVGSDVAEHAEVVGANHPQLREALDR